jgi:hypothetical protein
MNLFQKMHGTRPIGSDEGSVEAAAAVAYLRRSDA